MAKCYINQIRYLHAFMPQYLRTRLAAKGFRPMGIDSGDAMHHPDDRPHGCTVAVGIIACAYGQSNGFGKIPFTKQKGG